MTVPNVGAIKVPVAQEILEEHVKAAKIGFCAFAAMTAFMSIAAAFESDNDMRNRISLLAGISGGAIAIWAERWYVAASSLQSYINSSSRRP